MKSNGSGFDSILEALIQQKQVLADLQAENKALQQQLADLKAGRGIYIEILGTRIPLLVTSDTRVLDIIVDENTPVLNGLEVTAPVQAVVPEEEKDAALQETSLLQIATPDPALQPTTAIEAGTVDPALQPTTAISSQSVQTGERETPLPGSDFVIEDVSENDVPTPAHSASNFLEDALLSEFSAASTRHVGNWSAPITNGPITNNPDLDEEEKAALRRELLGSYILE